jgi:deoxyadenosine/deoxycytidine kinase
LPAPDLFIWLDTDVQTCLTRYRGRERELQIARQDDLELLQSNLVNWINENDPKPLLRLDGNVPIQILAEQAMNSPMLQTIIR